MGAMLSVFTLYRDPSAAAGWLIAALGFEQVNAFASEDGVPSHIELRRGEAVVIVERASVGHAPSAVVDRSSARAPYVVVEDDATVDAIHARGVDAGGTSLRAPETTAWGNHRCELLDPEGHEWSIGTYRPGQSW